MEQLFLEFFKIGLFSFGGGMSTLPYIFEMSKKTSWITLDEVNNFLTISQVTPGPLACNIGTITGLKVGGIVGAIIANSAFIIPAICFMGIGYKIFYKIKERKELLDILKTVRTASLAILISSSLPIFRQVFINQVENINYQNMFFVLNLRSIFFATVLYYFFKKIKINSICLIIISVVFAGIIRL